MSHQLSQKTSYGDMLREWRQKRRFSQLSLGLVANVSARHVSFLETGRAHPSREMVLQLAESLSMTKAAVNQALNLAGYASVYMERAANDADLAPIHRAIAHLLDGHMPYPAIALDRLWNIKGANKMAILLLKDTGLAGYQNLLDALCSQSPQQSSIVNWEEAVGLLLARLQSEMLELGPETELQTMVAKLARHFERYSKGEEIDRSKVVIPSRFLVGGQIISVFSTIVNFGSVQDVVLENLKIELMFPVDEASEKYFRSLGQLELPNHINI